MLNHITVLGKYTCGFRNYSDPYAFCSLYVTELILNGCNFNNSYYTDGQIAMLTQVFTQGNPRSYGWLAGHSFLVLVMF